MMLECIHQQCAVHDSMLAGLIVRSLGVVSRAGNLWAGWDGKHTKINASAKDATLSCQVVCMLCHCVVTVLLLMLQYNPEDGRGRTKPVSQEEAIEELVQTVCSVHCHPCRRCFMQNILFGR